MDKSKAFMIGVGSRRAVQCMALENRGKFLDGQHSYVQAGVAFKIFHIYQPCEAVEGSLSPSV